MIKYLNRIIYLGYYLKTEDKKKLKKFLNFVNKGSNISRSFLIVDMLKSSLKYNISFIDYFLFNFYKISDKEKKTYAGTGYMYEHELIMNPKKSRKILEDKLIFLEEYSAFVNHNYLAIDDIYKKKDEIDKILKNNSGKIVLKSTDGQCGIGIEVREAKEFSEESLLNRLKETGNDFVEDFVQQHDKLNELSPSGLNTVRIITHLDKKEKVDILGCRLRITINSSIDNLAAGNIAAPIDEKIGIIYAPAVYSDITKGDEEFHPITRVKIVGFQIPFWEESLQMVKDAALLHKQNRSIGWDIAITNEGPELIEGNHDWCKLLWQLPVKKGLKPILEKHKKEYPNND